MSDQDPITNEQFLNYSPWFKGIANGQFGVILDGLTNHALLINTLTTSGLVDEIVIGLVAMEEDFRTDVQVSIPLFIESLVERYPTIVLPEDTEERKRWAFLLCLGASILGDFSYGNLIIPSEDIYIE